MTVRNQGPGAGEAGTLKVWVNRLAAAGTNDAGDASIAVGPLASGASQVLTFAGLTAPSAAGTYNFRAFADGTGATVEQSEGNNQLTKTYTFTAPPPAPYVEKPDFSITSISFSPATLVRGGAFTAYVTVKNQGLAVANGGQLDVWVDRLAAANPGEHGDASMAVGAPLAIGASRMLIFTGLTASPAMGTHTFRAFVDSQTNTLEQSEGNNQSTKTYGFY